ncbi:MAG TPA: serine protease [Paracoccaceae bacterium]|nr:serine protease [Paracoccaceae bacterium]
MRPAALLVVLALALVAALPLRAQTGDRVWVQIEARQTAAQASERAAAWAAMFPDVAGFRMASGWHAVVLGPYTRAAAEERLARLLADNMIPSDSFLARGEVYRGAFWPPGADPASAPVQGAVPVAPVDTAALPAPAPEAPAPAPETPPVEAPAPAPPAEPEETLAEARAAEGRLNRDARLAIQSALQWAGFYNAAIDGAFGPGTRASISAWQEARGQVATGYLTTRQREALLGERAALEAELGLSTVTEAEAGIEIALPLAHVAFDGYAPPFVQFSEAQGSGLRVLLISQPGNAASLRALYDLLLSLDVVPPQGNRVLSERGFSIEGASVRISAQAEVQLSQGLIKGWMLVWEPRATELAAKALPLMRASFRPVGSRALDPGLVPLDEGLRQGMLVGMEVRKPLRSRSGIWVTRDGAVATVPEAVAGCGRITLDRGSEATVALTDASLGLAVLTPRSSMAPAVVAGWEATPPRPGTEVALSGYSYEDALPAPALTFGTLAAATGLEGEPQLRRLSLSPLPGDAGGPVLDNAGALVGMLLPQPEAGVRTLPAGVAFALSGDRIAQALAGAGIAMPEAQRNGALSPEELTLQATRMTVLVSCWE